MPMAVWAIPEVMSETDEAAELLRPAIWAAKLIPAGVEAAAAG